MADYNPNTVSAYQQYASSMTSSGGGRNASGLGARSSSSNMTSAPSGSVDFTTIDLDTGTQTPVATIDYGNDDNDYVSPTVIYTAAAEASTQAGSVMTPQGPMANAINLYSMTNMAEKASAFVYRADRDEAITSAIRSTQQEEQDQVDAAIKSVNSAITMGKTDAEIAEAFLNDMGGFGSDKPDETGEFGVQGTTLKDVTDTQQGLMTNPQPLYDFAEDMANPSITKTELPPMSPDEQAALGEAIRKAAEDATLLTKRSNIEYVSSSGDRTDASYWDRVFSGEAETDVDPETGQQIMSAEDVAERQGLMSRPAPAVEETDAFDTEVMTLIEKNEGNKNVPYKDTEGYWTVGIGHFIGKELPDEYKDENGEPKAISDEKVQELFKQDYAKHKAEAEALPHYDALDDNGKTVLIDLSFNMGGDKFNANKWPGFFDALADRDVNRAADELVDSRWYRQTKSRGKRMVARMRKAKFN